MNPRLKRTFKGLAKSWSANFSMLVIMLGGLEQYSGTLTLLFGAKYAGLLIMVGGLLGLALRFKTTQSLEQKGSPK